MLPEKDRVRLQHILDAGCAVLRFADGKCRHDLDDDEMLAFALPEIPWRQVVGMRHRLIHAYFEVDLNRVWDTATHYLPRLVNQLQAALGGDG